jgi:hypothetical protein
MFTNGEQTDFVRGGHGLLAAEIQDKPNQRLEPGNKMSVNHCVALVVLLIVYVYNFSDFGHQVPLSN